MNITETKSTTDTEFISARLLHAVPLMPDSFGISAGVS